MVISKACRKCGGDIADGDDGSGHKEWRCIQCCCQHFVIPGMAEWSTRAKGKFYRAHTDDMLFDLRRYGEPQFQTLWQLSNTGWYQMRRRLRQEGYNLPTLVKRTRATTRGAYKKQLQYRPIPDDLPLEVTEEDLKSQRFWKGYRQHALDIGMQARIVAQEDR